ncbi:hypothetical protein IWQ61_010356, partial [Dispira simplex]
LATQHVASDALVILTSEPISAGALAYHPQDPVALVELLGVECDPTKGLVPQWVLVSKLVVVAQVGLGVIETDYGD